MGDGECEEGQVWEAAMAAAHWKTDRLTAIVDHNKYEQTGPIEREMSLEPFPEKWRAFGREAAECDCHNVAEIVAAVERLRAVTGRPQVLVAHTAKGKGVSFMEQDFSFHGRALSPEMDARAREEIRCL